MMADLFVKGINGQVWVNRERVLISKKGVLATLIFGRSKERIIEVRHLQSINFQEAGWSCNGYLQFQSNDNEEKVTDILNARKNENTIIFNGDNNSEAVKVLEFIEKVINNRKNVE